jgi:hypothetical protein
MELALDVLHPKVEEAAKLRIVRGDVEVLPDESLEQAGMVRHVVDDLGRGEAVAVELASEIVSVSAHPIVPSAWSSCPDDARHASVVKWRSVYFRIVFKGLAAAREVC